MSERFQSGRFKGNDERVWFCAQRRGSRETIVCRSNDGHMTAADPQTFKRWAWTRLTAALTEGERT